MLSIENVTVLKNGTEVLRVDELTLDLSERYFIYGDLGAGKTTLFELITGITKPNSGDVKIGDVSIYNSDFMDLSLVRKRLGVMFDVPGLISNQNVYENIKLATDSKKMKFSGRLSTIIKDEYLKLFDMEEIIFLRPGVLSSEQKRVAAFIRSLITKPEFLVYDGFSNFLSCSHRKEIVGLIDSVYQTGVGGIFLAKEKTDYGIKFDRCFELKRGQIHEC